MVSTQSNSTSESPLTDRCPTCADLHTVEAEARLATKKVKALASSLPALRTASTARFGIALDRHAFPNQPPEWQSARDRPK